MNQRLICPEDGNPAELEAFCARVANLVDRYKWIVAVLYPPPFEDSSNRIEKECSGLLTRLKMPYKGLGWLFARNDIIKVLPSLFGALSDELILLTFDEIPTPEDVYKAWNAADGNPAKKVLFFDWSELFEVRVPDKGLGDEVLET